MKVTLNRDDVTAWKRWVEIEREGEKSLAQLFWDEHDGYDIIWRTPKPKWAENWDETNETPLAFVLDDLTSDQVMEIK